MTPSERLKALHRTSTDHLAAGIFKTACELFSIIGFIAAVGLIAAHLTGV